MHVYTVYVYIRMVGVAIASTFAFSPPGWDITDWEGGTTIFLTIFRKTRGASQICVAHGSHVRGCNDLKLKARHRHSFSIPFRKVMKMLRWKWKPFQIKNQKDIISNKNKKKQYNKQLKTTNCSARFTVNKNTNKPSSHLHGGIRTSRDPLPEGFGLWGRGGRNGLRWKWEHLTTNEKRTEKKRDSTKRWFLWMYQYT